MNRIAVMNRDDQRECSFFLLKLLIRDRWSATRALLARLFAAHSKLPDMQIITVQLVI
jgi:hypothetical protein